jgi:hypothetical protein
VETYSGAAATGDLGVRVERPGLAILADLLILSVLLYLWKTRPQMQHQGA